MQRTEPAARRPSNRSFGLVFAAFFLIVAFLPLLHGGAARAWGLGGAAIFLAAALGFPRALAPLNAAWMRLADLLHGITTPVALAVLFYGVVTPTGLMMRLLGEDPLRLKRDPATASYWIAREPPGPEPESLRNQF